MNNLQEIYEDVDYKHDVNYEFNNIKRFVKTVQIGAIRRLVENEGSRERGENGGINDKNKDHPIPDGLNNSIQFPFPFLYREKTPMR